MPRDVFYKISKERREKLIKPAIKEFVSKQYEKVTVLSLTNTMKILRTDFYYYFQDKDDLFNGILNSFEEYVQSINPDADLNERLVLLFKKVAALKGPKNRLYLLDLTESYSPLFINNIASRYQKSGEYSCSPEKAYIKCKVKFLKFMTILNEYLLARIDKDEAISMLDHKCCSK